MFNKKKKIMHIQKLTVVDHNEILVTLQNNGKFQKFVAGKGSDRKKFFDHEELLLIGQAMTQTKLLQHMYPKDVTSLRNVLFEGAVPSRATVARAILIILKKWDKKCTKEKCERPPSRALLENKDYRALYNAMGFRDSHESVRRG